MVQSLRCWNAEILEIGEKCCEKHLSVNSCIDEFCLYAEAQFEEGHTLILQLLLTIWRKILLGGSPICLQQTCDLFCLEGPFLFLRHSKRMASLSQKHFWGCHRSPWFWTMFILWRCSFRVLLVTSCSSYTQSLFLWASALKNLAPFCPFNIKTKRGPSLFS